MSNVIYIADWLRRRESLNDRLERLARIKATTDKINKLMRELRKK
jgi:hypothetical protein